MDSIKHYKIELFVVITKHVQRIMCDELTIPSEHILHTVEAIKVSVSSENEPIHADQVLMVITPPSIFTKGYNYYFKNAFTCQFCSQIIPIKKNNTYVVCTICNCKYHSDCHETWNSDLGRNQCFHCKCLFATTRTTVTC
jgi:hypothetical protein